jgi:hypothetical protein
MARLALRRWEPDVSFIETFNSVDNRLWRAGVPEAFLGKRSSEVRSPPPPSPRCVDDELRRTPGQMLRMLGYRRANAHKAVAATRNMELTTYRRKAMKKRPSGLPVSLDWRNYKGKNYDSPVKYAPAARVGDADLGCLPQEPGQLRQLLRHGHRVGGRGSRAHQEQAEGPHAALLAAGG